MSAGREWYDSVYGGFADELNAEIRAEAFGEEIGQNSWLTADEHRGFFGMLGLGESDEVLEVASGSGGPALFMVRETGCRVTGVDLHDDGVATANVAAAAAGLAERARFQRVDARAGLTFDDGSFDALLCIDSINHMYEREAVLRDWHRVLRPGGRLLFTDPIVVTGMIRARGDGVAQRRHGRVRVHSARPRRGAARGRSASTTSRSRTERPTWPPSRGRGAPRAAAARPSSTSARAAR